MYLKMFVSNICIKKKKGTYYIRDHSSDKKNLMKAPAKNEASVQMKILQDDQ